MANDTALRSALVWLAAVVAVVGLCTLSFQKMVATYVVGVVGLAGVLCPDWVYFDRDFSRWIHPVTAEERASHAAHRFGLGRIRMYPMRVIGYSIIYGFGLYKWWMFVSS
ncbi:signal peptidase complex-like protein DTM1 [Humulus lupulus]|uniref:signal peptidase complex-like protein DTM1 n=1 Tax=Humulus lupulus TaxID=3486 RepID=UPI002B407B8E|nr:signal peptidase complex-like protein DTM1 [Humulus lupulus]